MRSAVCRRSVSSSNVMFAQQLVRLVVPVLPGCRLVGTWVRRARLRDSDTEVRSVIGSRAGQRPPGLVPRSGGPPRARPPAPLWFGRRQAVRGRKASLWDAIGHCQGGGEERRMAASGGRLGPVASHR